MKEDMNINDLEMKSQQNNEISFKKLFNIFYRGKFIILTFTSIATLIGIFYSLIQKPLWRGSFQIVVIDKEKSTKISDLKSLVSPGLNTDYNKKTQEGILKSASVLMPIFEYAKKESKVRNLSIPYNYEKWLNKDLVIKFRKSTNILSVNYSSTDKELILNILERISKKYQQYSKRDREKSLNQGIEYLEDQQIKIEKASQKSLKALNKFSIENGLGDIDGFVSLGQRKNKINQLNEDLIINNLSSYDLVKSSLTDSIQDDSGAGQRFKTQFKLLERYESEYTNLKSKLKPNSKTLTILQEKIDNLRSSLKRPNEILLEFRNLKRIATRDESLLVDIEDNLERYKLEKAKQKDPWELISEPTIQNNRIAPQRKQITALTFLLAFFASNIFVIFKERISGKIFEFEDVLNNIDFQYLETFDINYSIINEKVIEGFFYQFLNKKNDTKLNFLNAKDIFSDKFKKNPNFLDPKYKINFIDFNQIRDLKEKEVFLIIEQGNHNKRELLLINKLLKPFKNSIKGWIFINKRKSFIE